MSDALLRTDLPWPCKRGKVRDVYDLGNQLLIVATDRISAFDVVLGDGIPDKGRILTALSAFWFEKLAHLSAHHLIESDVRKFPAPLREFSRLLEGRSMLVRKARVIPVECVARGYLAGSGWAEYQKTGAVCGIELPRGLRQSQRLPAPIFTPATKEESGHDQNISFSEAAARVGESRMHTLRGLTLDLYREAAEYAEARGIMIADTKFEFGRVDDGSIILIDEILTPDSSRFWPADKYQAGRDQESFDKQFVRNRLAERNWNKAPPAPRLPGEVVSGTRDRYLEAYRRLTGQVFAA
ncbi:MAG: phosphoribosylaminoimidazolesuccinocarboxamide synthase [Tepidisphaeraceae bacterium]